MPLILETLDPITVTVANTVYPLSSTPRFAASINLQAEYNNVGKISVGGLNVSSTSGILLDKGESATIEWPASQNDAVEFSVDKVGVTSSSSGDVVRVVIIKRE